MTDPTESVESLMEEEEREEAAAAVAASAAPVAALPPPPTTVNPTTTPALPQQQQEAEGETTTNMYPLDNEVKIDSEEIVDVIRNFIAEKDPMLELFLTVCFVHPHCFKAGSSK